MVYFLPLVFLLLFPVLLAILNRRWQRLALYWFVLIGITLISWLILLLARGQLPLSMSLLPRPTVDFPQSNPALLIDELSWPYGVALLTFLLAVLLTDVIRTYITESGENSRFQVTWWSWVIAMTYTGLGLAAILAGNLHTLVLGWAALDMTELTVRLVRQNHDEELQSAIRIFSIRALGILCALIGMIYLNSTGISPDFSSLNPQVSFWLYLAVGLRLGVLPFHISTPRQQLFPHNLETIFKYVPAGASLVILGRMASIASIPTASTIIILLTVAAGLLCGLSWMITKGFLASHPAWIAAAASLSMISAIFLQPAASLSWGLAMLLFGGLLALYTTKHKFINYILLAAFIGLTALPFTASWAGILVYYSQASNVLPQALIIIALILIPLIHTSLVVGAARRLLLSRPVNYGLERWIWWIYALGLLIIPLTSVLLAWLAGLWNAVSQASLTLVQASIPGFVVVILTLTALFIYWRGVRTPHRVSAAIEWLLNPVWLYRLMHGFYRLASLTVKTTDRVLEGAGGILWTLLLITLLASLIIQIALQTGQ